MDALKIKSEAWDSALQAEATRHAFQSRSDQLNRLTRMRDFVGLAVPVVTLSFLTSDLVPIIAPYKSIIMPILSTLTLLQFCLVIWSLVSRWDSELAYDVRTARDSYELREDWKSLAKKDETEDLNEEFDVLKGRQALVDSHDAEKGVTRKEMQRGMRVSLIMFQRECVCKSRPETLKAPWFPNKKCAVCGGN